jgi:hypothetical protein
MKKLTYGLAMAVLLYGCAGEIKKTTGDSSKVSINKIWVFKKIDTAKSSNLVNSGANWIGDNTIDMSNKDTLRYSTIATNNGTTVVPYSISRGYIFLAGKQTYKIMNMTDSTLELSAQYHVKEQSGEEHESTVVMIYRAR